jgi:TonB family protein
MSMWTTFIGAVILAATTTVPPESRDPSDFENPKFCSKNGELCLIVRRYPRVADFDRVTTEEYWKRDAVDEWLDEYPLPDVQQNETPQPLRAAFYRRWPSGFQELLSEFSFGVNEPNEHALISDDGSIATYGPMTCGADAVLLTIRSSRGAIVRTLRVRDVVTKNDQQWLCRGAASDVRWSLSDDPGTSTLDATILLTDGDWDAADARHRTLKIDLRTGAIPTPDRNLCPAALRVLAEPDDGRGNRKAFVTVGDAEAFRAADVVPIASTALLQRAVVRIEPEYPEVASKARISGWVLVEVVVGRDGHVEAARILPLPFGIDQSVKTAILGWQFEPYPSAVDATRFSGAFLFRFEIVRQWPVLTIP